MAKRNIIAGSILIAFGAWYAYQIGNLPDRSIMPNTPGPSFFPILIAIALLVLAASLLITGVLELRRTSMPGVDIAPNHYQPTAAAALLAFLIYLIVLPYAGFIIASIPMFAALMYCYGSRNKIMTAVASILIPVSLYVIFRFAFQIILPRGMLDF